MSNDVQLQDVADAREFLRSFNEQTQQRGEVYFREGRVRSVVEQEPGVFYKAKVRGSQTYDVELSYDPDEGWSDECSCPMQYGCKHSYAMLKTLLAEQTLSSVRKISSRAAKPGSNQSPGANGAPSAKDHPFGPFAAAVEAALNRPLRTEEAKFCRKVHELYAHCKARGCITYWDFEELGFSLKGYGWDAISIWPEFPKSEHEFWLYIANAIQERNLRFPDFLSPVTDLGQIQESLARWRRHKEVKKWKELLESSRASLERYAANVPSEIDFRVVLKKGQASLEWKQGQNHFIKVKKETFRQFLEDLEKTPASMPPGAALLCHLISSQCGYNNCSTDFHYDDPNALPMLGRILRTQGLESRVVDSEGNEVMREAQPLQWVLQEPGDEKGDYQLRLARANGQPAPELLCALPGNPFLYVSQKTIFSGPATPEDTLDLLGENLIPAPALETQQGLEFLQALGVPTPRRLSKRIRRIPVEVRIRCEIVPTYQGSTSEQCIFTVTSESADRKFRASWEGTQWLETVNPQRTKRQDEGAIVFYDHSFAAAVPALMSPLELKYDYSQRALALRVTKKFPELFAPWLKSIPAEIKVELVGELASFAESSVSGKVRLDVSEAELDWFDLRVVLDLSDTTLTPEEIKLLLNAKGGYVRLANRGWRRLQFDLSAEEDERLALLGLNPHELTSEPQRLHALQLADESAKKFLPEQQVEQISRRANEIKMRVTPPLPSGIKAELRPYQLEGFHFLSYLAANRFGGILADDMGLGKTLQTLAWLLWVREQAIAKSMPVLPSLVVCPKSVMDNWHAEAARFAPEVRVKSWPASELDSFLNRLGEADLHVLNYNQLRIIGESLAPVQWQAIILDEGQYIKNPNSQTAQVARALRAGHRLVLSGTPIENRLLDLWSLMAFVMPGALGSRHQFARLYDSKEDPLARRRLAARVRPFLLRRTKTQVAKDLPDRVEEDLFCEIEGEQKTLYRAELKRAQQRLLKVQTTQQLAKERFNFLTSLLRLRQICCHPALVNAESKAASAKVEALVEQLEPLMEEGQKVLVFSQFVDLLGLLKPVIEERGWPMFYLAGETENRGNLVREFQAAEGPAVFLISLRAGGFGLNLTAASYVVLFDPWWNPAVESQAIDRTHRIGQVNKVIAYRLLIKDSVEEKIRALQKQKSALAQDVLGEEKFAQSLSLDDLKFIFAD